MRVIGLFLFLDVLVLGSWAYVAPYKPTRFDFTGSLSQYNSKGRPDEDKAFLSECASDPEYSAYFSNAMLAIHVVLVGSGL
jgi:hypothetical protein